MQDICITKMYSYLWFIYGMLTALYICGIIDIRNTCIKKGGCLMSTKEKSRMMLSLPADLRKQLEIIAEADRRSLTNLIVVALEQYLKDYEQEKKA